MLVVQFLVNVENVDMQATEGSEGEECLPTPGYNLQFCYNESFYGPDHGHQVQPFLHLDPELDSFKNE